MLLVGDSLVYFAMPELAATFARHGVETRYVGYAGTGLLSGQGWWARDVADQVAAWHPDVVVIEACCNYMQHEPGFVLPDGSVAPPDTDAMFLAWTGQAVELVDRARAGGAEVFWAQTPDAAPGWPDRFRNRITHFNLISALLGVPRLDWKPVLEPGGAFTFAVPGPSGPVAVRKPDGLHLTDQGDQLIADATWAQIEPALPAG